MGRIAVKDLAASDGLDEVVIADRDLDLAHKVFMPPVVFEDGEWAEAAPLSGGEQYGFEPPVGLLHCYLSPRDSDRQRFAADGSGPLHRRPVVGVGQYRQPGGLRARGDHRTCAVL